MIEINSNPNQKDKKPSRLNWENILIAVLVIACATALWWLVAGIHSSYRQGSLRSRYHRRALITTPASPQQIQAWMTFDYINHIFNLTPDYLKQALNITDKKYPNVSLQSYAKQNNLNGQIFLQSIKQAVSNYGGKK